MRLSILAGLILLSYPVSVFAAPKIEFRSRELQEGHNFIKSIIAVPEVAEAAGPGTTSLPLETIRNFFRSWDAPPILAQQRENSHE